MTLRIAADPPGFGDTLRETGVLDGLHTKELAFLFQLGVGLRLPDQQQVKESRPVGAAGGRACFPGSFPLWDRRSPSDPG